MSVLCQAKVLNMSDDEISDIYLYGGIVWYHPGNDSEKSHFHVAKFVEDPENLEEMIYCLCDKTVIAVRCSDDDWKNLICYYGNKVYPRLTDDIECVSE